MQDGTAVGHESASARAKSLRSALLAFFVLIGCAIAAPTLAADFPLRYMLAATYGMAWPAYVAAGGTTRWKGASPTVVFLVTFPLFGLAPLLLVGMDTYASVAPLSFITWALGGAIAWLSAANK
jgi:hypothetical protein